ncbi:MAG: hypothetical protein JST92_06925 [Deltaproteobacteria bacterium]|nr:hypothetical protein [Deltaproteobacteria bacterium]
MNAISDTGAAAHEARRPWSFAATLVLAAIALWPYRHFAGDDAYISFRFAQNFASGAGFSFNPGVPTYGSTSPLWVFLLALGSKLGLDLLTASHLLDAIFIALTLGVFTKLCDRLIVSVPLRWAACALLILDPWFVHWAMSGMENPAALFLVSVALWARLEARTIPSRGWWAAIACGVGMLVRPEFAALTLLVCVDTWIFEKQRGLLRAIGAGLLVCALYLPWLVYAQRSFGSIVPNTVSAKTGAGRAMAAYGVLRAFASFYLFEAAGLALLLVLSAKAIVARLRTRAALERWFPVLGWSLLLPAFYVAGSAPVSARYVMFGLPAFLLVGVKSWDLLLREPRLVKPRVVVAALVAASLALVVAVQARYCWYISRWPRGMDPNMVAIGDLLRARAAPTDLLATDQIGVVGFVSGLRVLDMAALVSPELRGITRKGDGSPLLEAVRARQPQWVLLARTKDQLSKLDPTYATLEVVGDFLVQREGASEAGRPTRYWLYRTHWEQGQP